LTGVKARAGAVTEISSGRALSVARDPVLTIAGGRLTWPGTHAQAMEFAFKRRQADDSS